MTTYSQCVRDLRERFTELQSNEIEQLAVYSYCKDLNRDFDRAAWLSCLKDPCTNGFKAILEDGLQRRREGEPIQYIIGDAQFLDHFYLVDQRVLIPRPETEGLVLRVIEELRNAKIERGLEIGVGSGVISISLLDKISGLRMFATDSSSDAIAVATENASRILKDSNRLEFVAVSERGEVIPSGEAKFDFIVSNPPYVGEDDFVEASVLRFEPEQALYPEDRSDPLYFIERFQ